MNNPAQNYVSTTKDKITSFVLADLGLIEHLNGSGRLAVESVYAAAGSIMIVIPFSSTAFEMSNAANDITQAMDMVASARCLPGHDLRPIPNANFLGSVSGASSWPGLAMNRSGLNVIGSS